MRKFFTYISLFLLSILVVFLSVGVSISKMQCSTDGKFFLGTEVPNCIEELEISCGLEIQQVSCCKKTESIESCCPQTGDDSCASETANFQFDFETLMPSIEFNFDMISVLLYVSFTYNQVFHKTEQLNYLREIPLLSIHKPELSKIQSFLL